MPKSAFALGAATGWVAGVPAQPAAAAAKRITLRISIRNLRALVGQASGAAESYVGLHQIFPESAARAGAGRLGALIPGSPAHDANRTRRGPCGDGIQAVGLAGCIVALGETIHDPLGDVAGQIEDAAGGAILLGDADVRRALPGAGARHFVAARKRDVRA